MCGTNGCCRRLCLNKVFLVIIALLTLLGCLLPIILSFLVIKAAVNSSGSKLKISVTVNLTLGFLGLIIHGLLFAAIKKRPQWRLGVAAKLVYCVFMFFTSVTNFHTALRLSSVGENV
ncbi:hypothetical protein L596_009806 [Steinernema carpocapsae]|uniref:Uncharacterized protein n=1 Tax=Steinernema carpocapsae TaxID=34508 RepID=A0A4U5PGF0_STECR|nr:hypothetical protein L596_009806 [Steinernema carpocapsae]